MSRRLELTERALAEASAAADWYQTRQPGHGVQFRREFDHALRHIGEHPEAYQAVNEVFRRAFLRRFPFVVVYRVLPDVVEITGVLPTRSDPTVLELLTATRPFSVEP